MKLSKWWLRLVALGGAWVLAASWAQGAVTVTNVTVHQRFPWNGLVDIDYEVICPDADADAEIWVLPEATDGEHGTPLLMKTLSGEGAGPRVKPGRHRMTWDAKADNPGAHSSALIVKIKGWEKHSQTIAFTVIGPQTVGDRVHLSATATSGGMMTYEVLSGPGVLHENVLSFTGTGTVEVRALQAGNALWLPASATQTVEVGEAAQPVSRKER